MSKVWMVLMALVMGGAAHAQEYKYKWLDQDGKPRYGDQPPPGVKATPLQKAQPGGAVRGPAQASGDAGRAPSMPAEDGQIYGKRQQEAKKAGEKVN